MYRQKRIRINQWRLLIDFCVVFMLVLVLGMLTTLEIVNLYGSNNQAVLIVTQSHYLKYQNFNSIFNRTHYAEFLFNNFVNQLHRYLWYNQEDPLNDIGECSKVQYFEDFQKYCSPSWSSSVEDTGTYGSRWRLGGYEDVQRKSSAWRATEAANSNSSVTYGPTLNYYPSGGFIEDLGYEKDDTEDILANLITQDWLDHMTRAVFVELTLYNVNTGLFIQVILVSEQMPTGEYLVSATAESVNTEFSFHVWNVSFSIFFIFLLARMCILMNRNGIFAYLSKVINVFEVFLVTLGVLILIFYIVHTTTAFEYVQEFQRSGINEFFSFSNIISYSFMSRTVLCILFACGITRLLISWRFGRIYLTFYYTLFLSLPWIVWLILFFLLYRVIIWRVIAYLLNVYAFPFYTSVIDYNKDVFVLLETSQVKVLMYVMCMLSNIVILLFIACFAYYYKVAKCYKLRDTDLFNIYVFLKKTVKYRLKKSGNSK